MIEHRDTTGCFIKGNVSWNKRPDNSPSRIILARAGSGIFKKDLKVAARIIEPVP